MIRPTPRSALPLVLLFASDVHARIQSGAIAGMLRAGKAAIVPAAAVALTDGSKEVSDIVRTLESGQFTFPYLPVGSYGISVKRGGFAASEEKGRFTSVGIRLSRVEEI